MVAVFAQVLRLVVFGAAVALLALTAVGTTPRPGPCHHDQGVCDPAYQRYLDELRDEQWRDALLDQPPVIRIGL